MLLEHPEFLQAMLDGKLERKINNMWINISNGAIFDDPIEYYRVRPEPRKIIIANNITAMVRCIGEDDVTYYRNNGYAIFDAIERI